MYSTIVPMIDFDVKSEQDIDNNENVVKLKTTNS